MLHLFSKPCDDFSVQSCRIALPDGTPWHFSDPTQSYPVTLSFLAIFEAPWYIFPFQVLALVLSSYNYLLLMPLPPSGICSDWKCLFIEAFSD